MTTGIFASKVAGVTYKNPDGLERQTIIGFYVREGMEVIPKREPNNPVDPHAVGLWIKTRVWLVMPAEFQIGYINADHAGELSGHMDSGGDLRITVLGVTGGDDRSLGVNIRVDKTGTGTPLRTQTRASSRALGCLLVAILFVVFLAVAPLLIGPLECQPPRPATPSKAQPKTPPPVSGSPEQRQVTAPRDNGPRLRRI